MTDMKVKDFKVGDVMLVKSKFTHPAGVTIERVTKVYKSKETGEWFADTEAISTADGKMITTYIAEHHFKNQMLEVEPIPAPVFDKAMHYRKMYLASLRGLTVGAKMEINEAAKDGCDSNN